MKIRRIVGIRSIKKRKKSSYIDDVIERQEHLYDPGYYFGKFRAPILTNHIHPCVLGYSVIVIGLISIFSGLNNYLQSDKSILELSMLGLYVLISGILFYGGVSRVLQNRKSKNKNAKQQKNRKE